jgi:DNA-binding CsgD family transcriptional regulator
LELSADGLLCATQEGEPAIAARVQEFADAVHGGRSPQSASTMALARGPGRRRLSVFLRSRQKDLRKSPGKGTVLVIVLDSELPVGAVVPELQELYGFTASEARLANLLMEGKALEACCAELGIRRSTACTHLSRLFKKTGVHRQSELVSLLLRSIGLAHLADKSAKIGSADDGHAGLS